MAEDKSLSPEEKTKRSKKLKEEKEKEIADAQKKIKGSEEELKEKKKVKEKVSIPESDKQDLERLSEERKNILNERKDLRGNKKSSEDEDSDLEKLARERIELPPEVMNSQYAEQLSREPIGEIYKEMGSIYKAVEEKGYISREEEKKVEYLSSAVEIKIEAEESGSYSFSEEAARAASITKQMGASLINSYKGNKSGMYRSS